MKLENKRFISIRFKIVVSVISVVVLILLVINIMNYMGHKAELKIDKLMLEEEETNLQSEFEKVQKRVETSTIQTLYLIDGSYRMIENFYEESMKEPFKYFIEEYERVGGKPKYMNLEKVKKQLGGEMDLYVIDDKGKIIRATVYNEENPSEEVEKDFGRGNFYDRIQNIRKGNKIIVDRIAVDLFSGFLRIWSFAPTPDNKYILEFGLNATKVSKIVKEMSFFEIIKKIPENNNIIERIRIFGTDGILFGDSNFATNEEFEKYFKEIQSPKTSDPYKDLQEIFEKTISDGVYKKGDPLKDTEYKKYCYVDMDIKEKPTNQSKIVELTYNFEEMQNKLSKIQIAINEVENSLNTLIIFHIIFGLVAISIVILIIFILTGKITRPIIKLQDISDSLGNGDLTKRVEVKSNDEVGILSQHFNEFISFLAKMVKEIKTSTESAKNISLKLSHTSSESASALEQMTTNIENVKDKTVILDNEVELSNKSANEVYEFISDVVNLISTQASAVDESSTQLESMYTLIMKVVALTEEKMEMANRLRGTASEGQMEMKETMAMIKKVAESADLIMEMIEVINGIAKKTNLLAMNASIEAAHAGQSGKGFAVVASQIKKLAEDTSKNSKDISDSLKMIIEYIQISEESTDKTGNLFANIVKGIREVYGSMNEIKNKMQDLSLGSNNIINSLEQLVSITKNVKTSSNEMNEKVTKITKSTNNIYNISSEVKQGMEEVTIGINNLYETVSEVSEAGVKNAESVMIIESHINKFKIKEDLKESLKLIEDPENYS